MTRTLKSIVTLVFFVAACYFIAQPLAGSVRAGSIRASADDTLKKEPPKKVTLDKDSQDPKYGEVAFDHETHSTRNYTVDGKGMIACIVCHHTDQPAAALKPPLKTSERKVALSLEALKAPDAAGVKTCRSCHLQADDESKEIPSITLEGKTKPTKMTNEEAYHRNCNVCHDQAIAARPDLKGKIPGTNDCSKCHKLIE